MTFEELLAQANKAQKKFLPKEKQQPITERTLRYWIAKGVLEKRATRGPNTSYPEAFVWRVVLTRLHQLSYSTPLDDIAKIQSETADDDVKGAVEAFTRFQATGRPDKPVRQKAQKKAAEEQPQTEETTERRKPVDPYGDNYQRKIAANTKLQGKRPMPSYESSMERILDELRGQAYEKSRSADNLMGLLEAGFKTINRQLDEQRKEQMSMHHESLSQLISEVDGAMSYSRAQESERYQQSEMLVAMARDLESAITGLSQEIADLNIRLSKLEEDK
jgi:DNA-binding transcriptional MerR regulator